MAAAAGPASAFDLQGHRGARGLLPENTLAAFRAAMALGVTTLELDVGMTRDGVLVVHHDQHLSGDTARGPDGKFLAGKGPALRNLTLAQAKTYDMSRIRPGSNYATALPLQKDAEGQRIPTLEEVLALAAVPGAEALRFSIETKLTPETDNTAPPPDRFAKALADVVRKHGLAARVSVQSFDWRSLKAMEKIAPEIERVCLTAEGRFDTVQRGRPGASPWTAGLDVDSYEGSTPKLVKAAGCAVWSPALRDLSEEKVAEAHALGLKVIPWTVNEVYEVKRMIDWKADGAITDYPDRARKAMKERGLPLPAPIAVP